MQSGYIKQHKQSRITEPKFVIRNNHKGGKLQTIPLKDEFGNIMYNPDRTYKRCRHIRHA